MVWDLVQAQPLRSIMTVNGGSPPTIAFDPGGHQLAVARTDGELSVIDVRTGAIACTAGTTAAIERLLWTGSDEIAVARKGARFIELWDPRRCAVASRLEHPAPITASSTRPGPRIATSAGNVVHIWSHGGLEASFTGYQVGVWSVGIDGDDVYAIAGIPAEIVVDAIGDPARRRILRTESQIITDVRFDRAHGRIVAASLDRFLYMWDATTGARIGKLSGAGPLHAVRTSPDGSITIAVGGASPIVWDGATRRQVGELHGHQDLVQDGEFIDNQLFVSVARDHTALVWDVVSRRPLMKLDDVDLLVFSEDRRSIALVGTTGVRIWSPRAPLPDLDAIRVLLPK
jgi:WD40 repeat protein